MLIYQQKSEKSTGFFTKLLFAYFFLSWENRIIKYSVRNEVFYLRIKQNHYDKQQNIKGF